ncbi:MAG: GNAT family N-acetyltransferase [Thermoplasmatota archaeon]
MKGEPKKKLDREYKTYKREEVKPEIFEEYADLLHHYLQEFISKEALKEDLHQCFEKGRVVGVYHENSLIGAAVGIYTPFFEKFHIAHLAVEEEYQNRGLGAELIKRLIPEDIGASVHLNKDNTGLERFYEKLGFKPTHTRFKKMSEGSKPSD